MTRAEKVAEAQRLRAEGLKLREIGERMGYGISAVSAWLNDPDRSKEIARKKSYRGTCEGCGAQTDGSNGKDNAPTHCITCIRTRNSERNRRLEEMWEAGEPTWFIAQELGVTENCVRAWVTRERGRRGTDLTLRRLGGDSKQCEERHRRMISLREEGLDNAQIAVAVGMASAQAVSQAFSYLRRKGWEIPPPSGRGGHSVRVPQEDFVAAVESGDTYEEIARLLGYSNPGSVSNRVSALRRRGVLA